MEASHPKVAATKKEGQSKTRASNVTRLCKKTWSFATIEFFSWNSIKTYRMRGREISPSLVSQVLLNFQIFLQSQYHFAWEKVYSLERANFLCTSNPLTLGLQPQTLYLYQYQLQGVPTNSGQDSKAQLGLGILARTFWYTQYHSFYFSVGCLPIQIHREQMMISLFT